MPTSTALPTIPTLATAFASPEAAGRRVSPRLVATDVDGTLTTSGAIGSKVVAAVASLHAAGIEVMPVSGRPTGEVLGLCRYLPGVRRGIAENGLVEVMPDREPRWIHGEAPDLARLRRVGDALNSDLSAQLRVTGDAFCRLGDLAFERDGRDEAELIRLREAARQLGVHLVWSNVHVHLAHRPADKGEAVLRLLERDGIDPAAVATIGDAPNDAGLFGSDRFGLTVGTADVLEQLPHFERLPMFVSLAREANAFVELSDLLLRHAAD
ncbi:MAG: HAD family hydrolase [Nannocystaceae bacterium]